MPEIVPKANSVRQTVSAGSLPINSFIHRLMYKNPGLPEIDEDVMTFKVYYGTPAIWSDTIFFQIPPENIREDKSANFNSHDVLGRFEPIRMYAGSSPTSISFTVSYVWMSHDEGYIGTWKNIKRNMLKLKALTFPTNASANSKLSAADIRKVGRILPPPIVKFTFGDIYQELDCIVKSVGITYSSPWNDNVIPKIPTYNSQFSSTIGIINNLFGIGLPSDTSQRITSYDITDANKIFPFKTDISISLETAYPLSSWMTYNDVVDSGETFLASSVPIQNNIGSQSSFNNDKKDAGARTSQEVKPKQ